jgi:NADPH:quinone reductase
LEVIVKSIVIGRRGGPEELRVVDSSRPAPGRGQVCVKVHAAGVNFMDIGVREGLFWKHLAEPFTLGVEGAGVVEEAGEAAGDFKPGQRVAWVYAPGSYSEYAIVAAESLVSVPDEIELEAAAALMMQGVTAHHFTTRFYRVAPGDVALVHAAAGGVGQLVTQMVRILGGTVIGRVSTQSKAAVAEAAGAEHVIVESGGKFADRVRELTGGEGVNVVFDGSGASTFEDSLASLAYHGVLVYYGPGLGAPAPVNIATLPRSVLVGFPTFADHIRTRTALLRVTAALFDWYRDGRIRVNIGGRYKLEDAAQAHAAMEERRSVGKMLLLP